MSVNLTKVNQDLTAGRLWKARDRLMGMVKAYPADTKILELLGEIMYQMGDLPESGRYWYLTSLDGAKQEQSFQAFNERYGANPHEMLRSIPIFAPLATYPSIARERIEVLQAGCPQWQPPSEPPASREEIAWKNPHKYRELAVEILLAFVLFAPWMAGLITLILWLISLFWPSTKELLLNWLFFGIE